MVDVPDTQVENGRILGDKNQRGPKRANDNSGIKKDNSDVKAMGLDPNA